MPSPRRIAALYLLFGLLAVPLVAGTMPPFQHADEPNHVYRADQVSHGWVRGEVLPDGQSGGHVDAGLIAAEGPFDGLRFHQERKVTRAMYAPLAWGAPAPVGFPGSAIYPPVFYAPAAMALRLARGLGWPVLRGLVAARMATGFTALALGALAIALAGDGALWLFAVLTLPMSLSLAGAVSQDAPMLAAVALGVALLRGQAAPLSGGARWAAAACLALAAMARPPLAALALLFLPGPGALRARMGPALAVLAATVAWSLGQTHLMRPPPWVDARAQLGLLLHAPWRAVAVVAESFAGRWRPFLEGFVGRPGWLDVELPAAYHHAAWAILLLALVLTLFLVRPAWRPVLAAAAAMLGAVSGIVLIQYLTWTAPGADMADGVQGRYFLAPALVLAALPLRAASRILAPLAWPVLLFPLVTIPVLLHAILLRYYF